MTELYPETAAETPVAPAQEAQEAPTYRRRRRNDDEA